MKIYPFAGDYYGNTHNGNNVDILEVINDTNDTFALWHGQYWMIYIWEVLAWSVMQQKRQIINKVSENIRANQFIYPQSTCNWQLTGALPVAKTRYSTGDGFVGWSITKFTHQFRLAFGMITSSNGNICRVTGPLCEEFIGDRWINHNNVITHVW